MAIHYPTLVIGVISIFFLLILKMESKSSICIGCGCFKLIMEFILENNTKRSCSSWFVPGGLPSFNIPHFELTLLKI